MVKAIHQQGNALANTAESPDTETPPDGNKAPYNSTAILPVIQELVVPDKSKRRTLPPSVQEDLLLAMSGPRRVVLRDAPSVVPKDLEYISSSSPVRNPLLVVTEDQKTLSQAGSPARYTPLRNVEQKKTQEYLTRLQATDCALGGELRQEPQFHVKQLTFDARLRPSEAPQTNVFRRRIICASARREGQ